MRAIMLMFDTLTRSYLPNYGNNWVKADNFKRLGDHCITFDNFYGGSMPCMPARRELHTGRYNFLHRSWGPLEPFDESVIECMKNNGIYTHLCTDHSHYFEDGGATYHNRYDSWEGFRGQEGDRWMPHDLPIDVPFQHPYNKEASISLLQYYANLDMQKNEQDMSGVKTFQAGLSFMESHRDQDNWFLQIETFDPHEPFNVPQKYRDLYELDQSNIPVNWPSYRHYETMDLEVLAQMRKEYAALITMCDHYLGKIIDQMDKQDMWKDTMLIVNTDHGFLLGEHNWLGKNMAPLYNEIVLLPTFIWDPRFKKKGERRSALCQTLDIPCTLLSYFGIANHLNAQGKPLDEVIQKDVQIHDAILYGIHGGHINVCDGKYTYMRGEHMNVQLFEHTLMPTLMRGFFPRTWLKEMQLCQGDDFTHGIPYLKIPSQPTHCKVAQQDLLFDLQKDPVQEENIVNQEDVLQKMKNILYKKMVEANAPEEEFLRMKF